MSYLKSLTFVAAPKRVNDPSALRRTKLIAQLKQQREAIADPNYVTVTQRWQKSEDGSKRLVERQRRVKRWWQESATGECVLTVRYGSKMIEFEKGKGAISVGDKGNLAAVIDALMACVQQGELDMQLAAVQRQARKSKRPA